MLINIEDIKITDRIRKDFGNIQELADDIKQNGLINPPVVTPDNYELIAGERRVRAMKLLGYQQIEVRPMSIRDAEHTLNLEISENETRKDFSRSERIEYAKRLEQIERLKAKERMRATQNNDAGKAAQENFPGQDTEGQVRDIVAKKVGIGSGKQYEHEKYIVDHKAEITPEDFAEWDDYKLSTNKAYQKLKSENASLLSKNESLKEENAKLRVIPTKVREVEPPDYQELKKAAHDYKNDYARIHKENREKARKIGELEQTIEEMQNDEPKNMYIKKMIDAALVFNARVTTFIQDVGGYVWLADKINELPEEEQKGYMLSVQRVRAWAETLEYNINKNKGEN